MLALALFRQRVALVLLLTMCLAVLSSPCCEASMTNECSRSIVLQFFVRTTCLKNFRLLAPVLLVYVATVLAKFVEVHPSQSFVRSSPWRWSFVFRTRAAGRE